MAGERRLEATERLPDAWGDPAVWGALAHAEHIGFDWYEDDDGTLRCCAWPHDGVPEGLPALHHGDDPGPCVALAFLAKHGIEVAP